MKLPLQTWYQTDRFMDKDGYHRFFLNAKGTIVKRSTLARKQNGYRTTNRYRYIQSRTWVNRLEDLGPAEPEYQI